MTEEAQTERITHIWKILTGNGHPRTGLVYKVDQITERQVWLQRLIVIAILLNGSDLAAAVYTQFLK